MKSHWSAWIVLTTTAALSTHAHLIAAQDSTATIVDAIQETVTLLGSVQDSSTGQPLAGVSILIDSSDVPETTDSDGSFRLRNLKRGPHELLLLKDGYPPRTFGFFLTEFEKGEMTVEPLLLSHGSAPTVSIFGTVIDSLIGLPLSSADVLINGLNVAVTDNDGAFWLPSFRLEWGSNLLEFRRIGYTPKQAEVWTSTEDAELDIELELMPIALRMPEVVVEGNRTTYHFGRMRGFIRRSRTGLGHYITREDIEKRQPLIVSELLGHVPGIAVSPTAGGNRVEILRRTTLQGGCKPEIVVDGIRLNIVTGQKMKFGDADGQGFIQGRDIEIDDLVSPDEVEGIEVYTGPATTPAELSMVDTDCGVIVIWTRSQS